MRVEVSDKIRRLSGGGDDSLVSAARQGDHAAFELLMQRYTRMILVLALRVIGNRDDAEDIVQQTFHKAFTHLRTFEGRSSFSTWLTRIAINQALMLRRSYWRSRVISIDQFQLNTPEGAAPLQAPDPQSSPERSYARDERRRILRTALNELTPDMRAALCIRDIEERSTKEAARILKISVPAVKSRINRGRKLLRKKLERHLSFKREVPARGLTPAA